jgi:hypothetical protein
MAHPVTLEAGGSFENLDDAAAALSDLTNEIDGTEPEEEDEEQESNDQEEPADDGSDDLVEGDAEEGDEPAAKAPAIDAPVSLNAEAKAVFAQLPKEAQRVWSETETARNRQVQEATTRAADAQRTAEADAARQTTEAKQLFAQQVRLVADAYAPRQPNPTDYGDNMQAFTRDNANWQYAAAQHQQLMQQVNSIQGEASQAVQQQQAQWAQNEARKLAQSIPEWGDAAQRGQLLDDLNGIGSELGYTPELMAQAGADDILALRTAKGWKDKASKYDAIMARRMEGVRATKTAKPGVAQPKGSAQAAQRSNATTRLQKSGSLEDAAAALNGILK